MGTTSRKILGKADDQRAVPGRTIAPLGIKDASDPSVNMCMAPDTPGIVGKNDFADMSPSGSPQSGLSCPMLLFSQERVYRFLRSVAVSVALQQYTRLEWKEDYSSSVLNAIYAVMPWKGHPGYAEVNVPTKNKLDDSAHEKLAHYFDAFMNKLAAGPAAACQYLESMEEIRSFARESVQDVFRDAQSINSEIVGNVQTGIKRLQAIRAASETILKVAGLVSGSGFVVDLGYSITTSIIDDWDKAKGKPSSKEATSDQTVRLIGVASETALTESVKEKTTDTLEKWGGEWLEQHDKYQGEIDDLQKKIAERQSKLKKIVKHGKNVNQSKFTKKIVRLKDQAAWKESKAGRVLKKSKVLNKAAGGLSIVFAAQDIYKAWDRFADTEGELW